MPRPPFACLLAVLFCVSGLSADDAPPPTRALTGDDEKRATELVSQLGELDDAGRYADALAVARQIASLRQEKQGPTHWQTVSAKWQVAVLEKVAALSEQGKADWTKSRALAAQVKKLQDQERDAEALPLCQQLIELQTRLLGQDHPDMIVALKYLAATLEGLGRRADALPHRQKAVEIARKALGEEHPQTASTNTALARALEQNGRPTEALPIIRKAVEVDRQTVGPDDRETLLAEGYLASILGRLGKLVEAQPLLEKGLERARRLRGENSTDYAIACNGLAFNLFQQGQAAPAVPLFEKALTIISEKVGDSQAMAIACGNLASALDAADRLADALPHHRKALEIRLRLLGERHPAVANSYNNLGLSLYQQGQYAEAFVLMQKSLELHRGLLGDESPETISVLSNLATVLNTQMKSAEAEPLQRQVLALRRRTAGENHPDTGAAYAALALTLGPQGKHAEAKATYERCLAIYRKVYGEESVNTALAYMNLGHSIQEMGQPVAAETFFQKAYEMRRKLLGDGHSLTLGALANVASNLDLQGRYAEALPTYRGLLPLERQLFGDSHAQTLSTQRNLANALYALGRWEEAEKEWAAAADVYRRTRLNLTHVGIERAGMAYSPFPWLAVLSLRNSRLEQAWPFLEEDLGRALTDELAARQSRRLTPEERQQQQALTAAVQRLDKLISTAADVAETPERAKQRQEQLQRRTSAQTDLIQFEAELARKYGAAVGQRYELERIQSQLPADAALVAWLDVNGRPNYVTPLGEHYACVVRRHGPPAWVQLPGSGPQGAWTEEDQGLPNVVLTALMNPKSEWQAVARRFARQRIAPLQPLLAAKDGQPQVKHLIVLPSVRLSTIPVEALLTKEDDLSVSYAPSGTIYAWLRENQPKPMAQRPSLLALADPTFRKTNDQNLAPPPDHGLFLAAVAPNSVAAKAGLQPGDLLLGYGGVRLTQLSDLTGGIDQHKNEASVSVDAWRDGRDLKLTAGPGRLGVEIDKRSGPEALRSHRNFAALMEQTRGTSPVPLPGTRREVAAIAQTFKQRDPQAEILTLVGSDASEQRLQELAETDRLAGFRYLHLATHGIADDQRWLNSVLLLAQDHLPDPVAQAAAGKPVYNGQLTAGQIARTWRLNADLVVLSACETGLGRFGGGEGHVGFSQALILAGARSIVLSEWPVDDAATALLMMRFYENLLGARTDKAMAKAEALTEAKEWLRNLTRVEIEKRLAQLPEAARGLKLESATGTTPLADRPFAHPYYWSAFILIGDPN